MDKSKKQNELINDDLIKSVETTVIKGNGAFKQMLLDYMFGSDDLTNWNSDDDVQKNPLFRLLYISDLIGDESSFWENPYEVSSQLQEYKTELITSLGILFENRSWKKDNLHSYQNLLLEYEKISKLVGWTNEQTNRILKRFTTAYNTDQDNYLTPLDRSDKYVDRVLFMLILLNTYKAISDSREFEVFMREILYLLDIDINITNLDPEEIRHNALMNTNYTDGNMSSGMRMNAREILKC